MKKTLIEPLEPIGFKIFVMNANKMIFVLFENMLLLHMNVSFVYCCSTVVLHVLGRSQEEGQTLFVENGVVWKTGGRVSYLHLL